MCEPILKNELIFSGFETRVIPISYATNVKNIGVHHPKKFFALARFLFRTIRTLVSFRPDNVYFVPSLTGVAFLRDLLFILAIRVSWSRRIFHIHGMGMGECAKKSGLFRRFYKLAFNGSELIILSELLRGEIGFLHPAKVHVIPNGIEPVSFSRIQHDRTPIKLLFVSNFYSYKGVNDLINLLASAKAAGCRFTCDIIGEEKDITYNELGLLIAHNDLTDHVACHSSIQGEELYQLFSGSNIFIYPTKKDAMPLVILEAMRAGMAVLANPVGAIPEMLELTSDLYPTPENLKVLLNDPGKISKLGTKNRQLFEDRFTLDQFHQNLFRIISTVQK